MNWDCLIKGDIQKVQGRGASRTGLGSTVVEHLAGMTFQELTLCKDGGLLQYHT